MSVTITVPDYQVLESLTSSTVVEFFGNDLLTYFSESSLIEAAGGLEHLVSYLPDDKIDEEFLHRHPNPSEILDYLDDEAIMDYLINKGYNIEM